MALEKAVGTFSLRATTGSQAITGVGFLPKFVLFSSQRGTSGAHYIHSIGVADGSAQWAMAMRSSDGLGTTVTDRGFATDECIYFTTGAGNDYIRVDFTSLDADGFTINVSVRGSGGREVQYMCLGGSDFSVDVGTFNSNATTGNQSVTGVGFVPKCTLFGNTISDTTLGSTTNNVGMLGAAASSSARWAMCEVDASGGGTSNADRYYNTDRCIVRPNTSQTVVDSADFVSNDADGFTVNLTVATTARSYGYVCFGGDAQYYVGSFASATSTGNQAITGVGFQPDCEMFISQSHTATGFTTHAKLMLGLAVSATERACISSSSTDAVGTSESSYDQTVADCITHISGGTPTVDAQADFVSQDSDGFTVNWGTAAAAHVNLLIAIGAAAGGTAYTQSAGGVLAPTGAINKKIFLFPVGTITPAGAITKQTAKSPVGTITPAGAVTKQTAKSPSGTITPTGDMTSRIVFVIAIAGAIAPAGALFKKVGKAVAGILTPAGTISKKTAKSQAGAITPAGNVLKLTKKSPSGAVTPTGSVAAGYQTDQAAAGTITPSGTVAGVKVILVAAVSSIRRMYYRYLGRR